MIKKILDDSKIKSFVDISEVNKWQERVSEVHNRLHQDYGESKNEMMLGWLNLPVNYDKEEFNRIKLAAEKIQNDSEILVVIGIGGAYMCARIVVEALEQKSGVKTLYAGNNLSSRQIENILAEIEGKKVSLNVISKSGTTTETMLAFRVLRNWMEKKYGEKAAERIYVTTDREKGTLKGVADKKGYEVFIVPTDIGDRYAVFTPESLLPMAVAGINIDEFMRGGIDAYGDCNNENLEENEAYRYAVYRNILYNSGKEVEILANYEPRLHFVSEWWKQLFGESEGKDKKGIFPASVDLTTDLHSMGQFMQDGNRIIFETVLNIEEDEMKMEIKKEENDFDGLNYLAGKTLEEVNRTAMEATIMAHTDGGVPNLIINLPKLDAYNLGYLIYFWEKACAMSGYLLGVNPFNQPGVEEYKKNMFKLLGKPGY
jgi:glucose-6-phosphate isomerase